MNKPVTRSSVAAVEPAESELHIRIAEDFCVEYSGTRAQLEEEGIIPAETMWPEGRARSEWRRDGLKFALNRRLRPGTKGMKLADSDFWCLRFQPAQSLHWSEIERKRRAKEHGEWAYRQSKEGTRRRREQRQAVQRAGSDTAFQAFLAKIPALATPPRRSRKPKVSVEANNE